LRSASSCTSKSRSLADSQHNSTRAKHTTTLPSLSRRPSVLTPPLHFVFVHCVTQGVVGLRPVVRWQARPKGAVHLHTHGAWRCMRRLWSWLFLFNYCLHHPIVCNCNSFISSVRTSALRSLRRSVIEAHHVLKARNSQMPRLHNPPTPYNSLVSHTISLTRSHTRAR
jgi:hypothetical protein